MVAVKGHRLAPPPSHRLVAQATATETATKTATDTATEMATAVDPIFLTRFCLKHTPSYVLEVLNLRSVLNQNPARFAIFALHKNNSSILIPLLIVLCQYIGTK